MAISYNGLWKQLIDHGMKKGDLCAKEDIAEITKIYGDFKESEISQIYDDEDFGYTKIMVVTPSRLHAVRYVQEFKRQIKEKGLNDLEVLVAFSGEVKDNDDVFTEEGMNKDKEGKTSR